MKPLSELVKAPVLKKGSEKGEITKDLYALYTSPNARKHRKSNNWAAFKLWLLDHGLPVNKRTIKDQARIAAFKKTNQYIEECDLKRFAVRLSKHSRDVLYEILSIAKDKDRRGENTGAYIGGNFWSFR